MYPLHLWIAALNLACAVATTAAFLLQSSQTALVRLLGTIGILGGGLANFTAFVVAFFLAVILVVRFLQGKVPATLKKHWLGLVNGVFFGVLWVIVWATFGISI